MLLVSASCYFLYLAFLGRATKQAFSERLRSYTRADKLLLAYSSTRKLDGTHDQAKDSDILGAVLSAYGWR